MLESLFNKVAVVTLLKIETSTGDVKYCEVFKSTYFEEHLRTAAS